MYTCSLLKTALNDINADRIPRSNYYGWFAKVSKGVYGISEKGFEILNGNEYTKAVEYYRNLVNNSI